MVFLPPAHLPPLPEIPDSVSIADFLAKEQYGRHAFSSSQSPFTCGVTGKSPSASDVMQRIDHLARGIGKKLGYSLSEGTEWNRVVCVYSVNTIDYIPLALSVHRLSGIVTPASAAYSPPELEHQLRSSGANALFTCMPLLETALKAAKAVGIPDSRIFILEVPGAKNTSPYQSVDQLMSEGAKLPALEPLRWVKGQGKRQTAFLCFSSGTSGLPKAVMLSHHNIIANLIQISTAESVSRRQLGFDTQTAVGVLPFSHIYGLTVISLIAMYRGDGVVVLPKFDLGMFLSAIQKHKIELLPVVTPIIVQLITNKDKCAEYDLSSVRHIYSGAAPLGTETVDNLLAIYPKWHVSQGYGMTEASPGVSTADELDTLNGSSGTLLPGSKAKLIDSEGKEVTGFETRGELLVQSPAVALGYLHNEKANAETFVWHEDGRWLMTGDEIVIRKSKKGHQHVVVVDRIKELIKTKGHQVAPAELEAHLLAHSYVSDCAVIAVQDQAAGELPKAFVVRSKEANGKSDEEVRTSICKDVENQKARHKWLKGGVEFIDVIPKSPSGKILRRLLRDSDKAKAKANGPKL